MRLRKDDRLRKADGVRKVECLRKDDRVRRERVELNVPGSDYRLGVIRHGHYGRPVLVFPREGDARRILLTTAWSRRCSGWSTRGG